MPAIRISKASQKKIIYLVYLLAVAIFVYFHPVQNKSNQTIDDTDQVQQYDRKSDRLSLSTNSEKIYFIGAYQVTKIVDGDTVHVLDSENKPDIVRFLAVNTPEIHNATSSEVCHGKISSNFTKQNLLNNKVFLFGDSTQPKRDKYARLLAYVSLEPYANTENVFFNELLITTGNAKVYRATPPATNYYKYVELQKQAQEERLGMWNSEVCK